MNAEKLVFAFLACVLLASLAFLALGAGSKQPVAFFAYGPNLARSTMNARAGGFINASAAQMPGYSLAFARQDARPTEFGVATLVQGGSAAVQGALYYLTSEQMAALDRQAGAPDFYQRREIAVVAGGKLMQAQAYFLSGPTSPAAPSRPYYLAAMEGVEEWGYGAGSLDAAVAASSGN